MTMKICTNCGEKLEANEKFCPTCGEKITTTTNNTTTFQPDDGLWENLFKIEGRLNRWRYFKRSFAMFFLYILSVIATCAIFLEPSGEVSTAGCVVILILTILLPIGSTCLTIRRLHDLNLTGWLCLLGTIPAVNTAFWIYTTFAQGTIGANRYGADPLAVSC